jgi:hypothetical protein
MIYNDTSPVLAKILVSSLFVYIKTKSCVLKFTPITKHIYFLKNSKGKVSSLDISRKDQIVNVISFS